MVYCLLENKLLINRSIAKVMVGKCDNCDEDFPPVFTSFAWPVEKDTVETATMKAMLRKPIPICTLYMIMENARVARHGLMFWMMQATMLIGDILFWATIEYHFFP